MNEKNLPGNQVHELHPVPYASIDSPVEPRIDFPGNLPSTGVPRGMVEESVEMSSYSGPTPPLDHLAGLHALNPNYADRVLSMSEAEQRHRHNITAKSQEHAFLIAKSDQNAKRRGQICATIVAVVCIAGAVFCAYLGDTTVGGIIGGATILGLVTVFVTGKALERKAVSDASESQDGQVEESPDDRGPPSRSA